MHLYKRIFYVLVLVSPLINFSVVRNSNLPIVYILTLLFAIFIILIYPRVHSKAFGAEDVFFLGFISWSLISYFVNRDTFPGTTGISQIANLVLTYTLFKFFMILLFRAKEEPKTLLRRVFRIFTYLQGLAIFVFLVGLFSPGFLQAFVEFFNNSGNFDLGAIGVSFKTARSFGFAPEPSFWSFFIAVSIALALVIPKPGRVLMFVNFLNLILTFGRTGYLIVACIFVIKWSRVSPVYNALLIVGLLLGSVWLFDFSSGWQLQSVDISVVQRIESLIVAFNLAIDNPVFGIGFGNFNSYSREQGLEYFDVFNLFLGVLVSSGFPGLILFCLVLLLILGRIAPSINLPFYAVIVGWMTVSAYNLPFVWLVFAVLIYCTVKEKDTEPFQAKLR